MKTYIISTHFNNTNFIELQYNSLNKYFKEEYEYIIINDAKNYADYTNFYDKNLKIKIEEKCKELNIKCINVPQDIHINRQILFPNTIEKKSDTSYTRCADALQYGFNYYCCMNNIYLMILDSDMFFIKDFYISKYIEQYDIVIVPKIRTNNIDVYIEYAWNGLCIFNLNKLKNLNEFSWDCGNIYNVPVDVGGNNYFYIEKYKPHMKKISSIHYTNYESYCNINDDLINLFNIISEYSSDNNCNKELFLDYSLLHLRCGGNWDNKNEIFFKKQFYFIDKYINPDRVSILECNDISCTLNICENEKTLFENNIIDFIKCFNYNTIFDFYLMTYSKLDSDKYDEIINILNKYNINLKLYFYWDDINHIEYHYIEDDLLNKYNDLYDSIYKLDKNIMYRKYILYCKFKEFKELYKLEYNWIALSSFFISRLIKLNNEFFIDNNILYSSIDILFISNEINIEKLLDFGKNFNYINDDRLFNNIDFRNYYYNYNYNLASVYPISCNETQLLFYIFENKIYNEFINYDFTHPEIININFINNIFNNQLINFNENEKNILLTKSNRSKKYPILFNILCSNR